MEEHHILGEDNDPATIGTPGNQHRVQEAMKLDWPAAVRYNADRDPLLWLAGGACSLRDHLAIWVEWLGRIALWLVALAEALRERFGTKWWQELGVGPLWGEA